MVPIGTPLDTHAQHSKECELKTAGHAHEERHKHHHILKAFCSHKEHHEPTCEDNSLAHTTSQHGHGHHIVSHPSHEPYVHPPTKAESSDALLARQIAEQRKLNQREADLAVVGEIKGMEDRHILPGRGHGEGTMGGHELRNVQAGNLGQDSRIGGGRSTVEERVPQSNAPKFI